MRHKRAAGRLYWSTSARATYVASPISMPPRSAHAGKGVRDLGVSEVRVAQLPQCDASWSHLDKLGVGAARGSKRCEIVRV